MRCEEVVITEKIVQNPEDNDGHTIRSSDVGENSVLGASILIANSILGAGLLSLPEVMRSFGLIFGNLLLILNALSTIYSVIILMKCKDLTGKLGYNIYAKISYGEYGAFLVKFAIIFNNFGICCAYFKIFGTVVSNFVGVFIEKSSFFVSNWHNFFYILMIFLIMSIFIFQDRIDSLKKTAFVAITGFSVFFICIIITYIYKSINGTTISFNNQLLLPVGSIFYILADLPGTFVAFTFQFNLFPIYSTLAEKSNKNITNAVKLGVCYCLLIYIISSSFCYLIYGDLVHKSILTVIGDDINKSKGHDTVLVSILSLINIGFMISSMMSIPLMFFSLKKNFINTIIYFRRKKLEIKSKKDLNNSMNSMMN